MAIRPEETIHIKQEEEKIKARERAEIILDYRDKMQKLMLERKKCNLTTCRYNKDGKCTNEEKRKECVEVSRKVLGLEGCDNE